MQLLKVKNFTWVILKKIANLNFALSILFLIISLSVLGTLIEQDQSISFYQNSYPDHRYLFNWKIIIFLGLDHIYQTWWFMFVILIFAICLTVCTFSVQLPSLKNARRWKFRNYILDKHNNKVSAGYMSNYNNKLGMHSITNMLYSLSYQGYFIFNKSKYIYAYKGLLGRLAPVFVHLSMLFSLFGFLISILTNFMDQEMVASGEIFHLKNIVHAGQASHLYRNVIGRVHDFFIKYNSDNSVKQFFSDISLINNNGNILVTKTISVNQPLFFRGLTIYQTDWSIDALRLQIGDLYIQKKLYRIEINNKACWVSDFIIDNNTRFVVIVFSLNNEMFLYNINTDIVELILLNRTILINDIKLIIQDIMVSTGLQIKVDPGIIIVYFSFLCIMISTFISYISYSQVWITIELQILSMSGNTNRAILLFEEEIIKINRLYQKYSL